MLKNISDLGAILSKTEQQSIHGGNAPCFRCRCPSGSIIIACGYDFAEACAEAC